MDLTLETGALASTALNEEYEYQLSLTFTSLTLADESIRKVQIILIWGDLMSKFEMFKNENMNGDDNEGQKLKEDERGSNHNNFEDEQKVFIIHSTPTELTKKLSELSIAFAILNEKNETLGKPMMVEMKECFTNSVQCAKFKKESFERAFQILTCDDECLLGQISIVLTVTKDLANSKRFRPFYEQSTAEKQK